MRWDVLAAAAPKVLLSKALVEVTPRAGWTLQALRAAAALALGDAERWRDYFPRGSRDAIWFISELSDASMKSAFDKRLATNMSEVIRERLDQNFDLKPFVRRVMMFDLLHPSQALSRMQRTAHVMFACVNKGRAGFLRLSALNLAYTTIVFYWLLDQSEGNSQTHALTRALMALLRL